MKLSGFIVAVLLLPQLCFASDNVCVHLNGGADEVYVGQWNTLEIWIENDNDIQTMVLSFGISWDPSITVSWNTTYGNYPPVQSHGRAIDAFDAGFWAHYDFDLVSPDHISVSGVAIGNGLPAGPSALCYSLQFMVTGADMVSSGFCVQPSDYNDPPSPDWMFAGYPATFPPDFCSYPVVDMDEPYAPPVCFDVVGIVDLDPDDGKNEVGVEYVDMYQGSVCGGGFSGIGHWDAWALGHDMEYLLNWHWSFFLGEMDALEWHFDEYNDGYVDNVDLVYFCGQGKPQVIEFRGMGSGYDETCQLFPDEVALEWGDKDLEWVIFNSAQTMSAGQQWNVAFNGLHGIMGFSSAMSSELHGLRFYSSGLPALMDRLAYYLAGTTVWDAFISAVWTAYDPVGAFDIVGVFPQSIREGEYVWGTGGNHYDDPSPDEAKYVMKFTGSGKEEEPAPQNPDLDNRVAVSNGDNGSLVVSVLSDLAARVSEPSDTLYHLVVQHRTVDESYVGDLADSFCYNYGWFCEKNMAYNAEAGTYELADGPHILTIYEETGGWHYTQKDLSVIHGDYAPDLLADYEVHPASEQAWEHFGGLPSDTFHLGPFYMNSAMYTNEGELVPDSSWDIEVTMSYVRNRDGKPVFGPGAGMSITFGDSAKIYNIHHGGWRNVIEGEAVVPVPLQDAIDNLALNGWDVSLCGVPHHDELIVYDAVTGYYEPGADSLVDELQPVWFLRSYCLLESDTTVMDIIVPAEYLNPYAEIIVPENDTTINEGDTLFLNAYVYGAQPLECAWYSDVDGLIDTGEVAWVSDLSPVNMGDHYHSHLITLEVTDGNGMLNHDYVFVTVIPNYICGDTDGSGAVDIDDIVYLISYIFSGGPVPDPIESGDADCSGAIDIDDVVYLIAYVFSGGPPPGDPNNDGVPDC